MGGKKNKEASEASSACEVASDVSDNESSTASSGSDSDGSDSEPIAASASKKKNVPKKKDAPSTQKKKKKGKKKLPKVQLSEQDKQAGISIPNTKLRRLMSAYWEKDGLDGDDKPPSMRNNIHFFMASILGDLVLLLGAASQGSAKKNDMHVKTIEEADLRASIREDSVLRRLFHALLDFYNPSTHYAEHSVLGGLELNHILSNSSKRLQFGPSGRNLVCFLINEFFNESMAALRSIKEELFETRTSVNSSMLRAVFRVFMQRKSIERLWKAAGERIKNLEEYNAQHRQELDEIKQSSEASPEDGTSRKKKPAKTSSKRTSESSASSSDSDGDSDNSDASDSSSAGDDSD
jgi:hypothetical protein